MKYNPHKVSLISDLHELVEELTPQPMWMVRPQMNRKYATQRMTTTAEVVNLTTVNLAKMSTFETV